MIVLTISATTTDDQIERAIPFLDMREHAIERRDDAAAVIDEQGDQVVLELHDIDGVAVLWSPVFGYAYVNHDGPGRGNSLFFGDTSGCTSADDAALAWSDGGSE